MSVTYAITIDQIEAMRRAEDSYVLYQLGLTMLTHVAYCRDPYANPGRTCTMPHLHALPWPIKVRVKEQLETYSQAMDDLAYPR